jgi:hypothetical protein
MKRILILEVKKERKPLKLSERKSPGKDSLPNKIIDHRRKMIPYYYATEEEKKIINWWNILECGTTHSYTCKSVEKTLYLLRTKLLKEYSCQDILKTIRHYSNMKKKPWKFIGFYKPKGIFDFFQVSDFAKKSNKKDLKSTFESLVGKTKDEFSFDDRHPEITNMLMIYYSKNILGKSTLNFSDSEKDKFIRASAILNKFIRSGEMKGYITDPTLDQYIEILFHAIADQLGSMEDINIGNLKSKTVYDNWIPRYLRKHFSSKQALPMHFPVKFEN